MNNKMRNTNCEQMVTFNPPSSGISTPGLIAAGCGILMLAFGIGTIMADKCSYSGYVAGFNDAYTGFVNQNSSQYINTDPRHNK